MNQRQVTAVVWKELKAMSRTPVIAGLFFSLFWAVLGALGASNNNAEAQVGTVNSFVSYIPLVLILYVGNSLIMPMFLGEKSQRAIETLLCSPLQVREMWFGKVLAVFIVAYGILLATAAVYVSVLLLQKGMFPELNRFAFVQLLIVSPLLALAIFGLMGHLFLVLLNPAVVHYANLLVMIGALVAIYRTLSKLVVNGITVSILFFAALALLGFVAYLSGHLNKERIVTAIE